MGEFDPKRIVKLTMPPATLLNDSGFFWGHMKVMMLKRQEILLGPRDLELSDSHGGPVFFWRSLQVACSVRMWNI